MPTRRTVLTDLGLGGAAAMLGSLAGGAATAVSSTPPVAAAQPTRRARPFFDVADWLWQPIPADPRLDPHSATWAAALARGSQILNTYQYGVPVFTNHDSRGVRRPGSWQRIAVRRSDWGTNPFAAFNPIWIPSHAAPSPQSDAAMVIIDPVRRLSVELWQARRDSAGRWSAGWGAVLSLDGRADRYAVAGVDTGQQGAVGAGVSRRAGLVTRADIAAGAIHHALVLSSDMVAPGVVRFPATKTDGRNLIRAAVPIPEGARIQLDPRADLSDLHGYQLLIARALQRYGAYVIDNGGARVAIIGEGHDPHGPRTGAPYFSRTTPVPRNPVYRGSTFWRSGCAAPADTSRWRASRGTGSVCSPPGTAADPRARGFAAGAGRRSGARPAPESVQVPLVWSWAQSSRR